MQIGLDRLGPGKTGIVTEVNMPPDTVQRLRCFGLIPGVTVRCSYRSPGGKVTALDVFDTVIAMRTGDLSMIRVSCL